MLCQVTYINVMKTKGFSGVFVVFRGDFVMICMVIAKSADKCQNLITTVYDLF